MNFIVVILLFLSSVGFAEVENEKLVFSCEAISSGDDSGIERYAINIYQIGRSRYALKEIVTEYGVTRINTFSDELKECQHLQGQPLVFDCQGTMGGKVSQVSSEFTNRLVLGRQTAGPKPIERQLLNIYVYPGDIRPDFTFSPKDCKSNW